MEKVAILICVSSQDGTKVRQFVDIDELDLHFLVSKYGSVRSGLRKLYSRCPGYSIVDYWLIDSVRIHFEF